MRLSSGKGANPLKKISVMQRNKILVVDDDINLLYLIHMRLEAAGYNVVTANHENVAKEVASQEVFDVAIVDLQLVKQDGISLMEELHDIHPNLPVIIMTAHGSREIAVEAIKSGAFKYLVKPFDSRELILQIERAREKSKDHGELQLKNIVAPRFIFSNSC